MNDNLATYLHDHLTGSHFAVQLLDSLHEQYKDEDLGQLAMELCAEIKQDQSTLEQIIEHVGKAHFALTEAVGRLLEKVSQLKLGCGDSDRGIGTFEALETLSLGIRGKLALWRALPLIREVDQRVPPKDYEQLLARAHDQYTRVEERRLQLVRETFQR